MIRLLPLALALSVLACRGRGRPPDRLPVFDAGADLRALVQEQPAPAAEPPTPDPDPPREARPARESSPTPAPPPPNPAPSPNPAPPPAPEARPEPRPQPSADARPASEPRPASDPRPARAAVATERRTLASAPPGAPPPSTASPPDAGARPDAGAQPIVVEAEAATGRASPAPGPSPSDLVAGPRRLKKSRGGAAPAPLPIPGGPLAIPGGTVDLDSVRVERFAETGGTTLDGRLLDVDSRQPVAGAQIEAWMGTRSIHAQSDADGRFRFEGLVPRSKITLWITAAPTFVQERLDVAVPAGDSFQTTYQLLPRASGTGSRDAGVGLFLSRRGSRTVITGLTAWGPAERAGIQTGETVLAVGKRDVTALGPGAIDFLLRGPMGTEVTVTVQAGSAPPRTLTLKRSGR